MTNKRMWAIRSGRLAQKSEWANPLVFFEQIANFSLYSQKISDLLNKNTKKSYFLYVF